MGVLKYIVLVHILFMIVGSMWLIREDFNFQEKDFEDIASIFSSHYKPNMLTQFVSLQSETNVDARELRQHLHTRFPYILPEQRFPPLQLRTGGLIGQIHLFYASMTEILLLYHSPLETSGNSGRHFMDISVTVLNGKVAIINSSMKFAKEFSTADTYRYAAGGQHLLKMDQESYILIYGRGLVPLSMYYGLSDAALSSFDLPTAVQTVSYYMRAVHSNWNIEKYLEDFYTYAWTAASNGNESLPRAFNSVKSFLIDLTRHVF